MYFWLLFVPVLVGFVVSWLFVTLMRRSVKLAAAFLGVVLLQGVLAAIITVNTFGGAFGPGLLLCILAPIAAVASLVVLVAARQKSFSLFGEDRRRYWLYIAGGALVVAAQCSPLFGSYAVTGFCYAMHRQAGQALIEGVEAYHGDHGQYPTELSQLVPAYIAAVPIPPCARISAHEDKYELESCGSGPLLLTTESVDGVRVERYDFERGRWSAISFLDGACSFLD